MIPTSDKSLVPLMAHRDEIARLSRFAAPTDVGFRVTNRKDETISIATACGLHVPRTIRVDDAAQADGMVPPFSYPVVLKPIVSHTPGRAERLRVRVVHSQDELSAAPAGDGCRKSGAGAGVLPRDGARTERAGASR